MLKLKKYDVGPMLHNSPVSSPKVSPDGTRVLFVRSTVDREVEKYESHVWMVRTDGGEPKQLTHGDGSDSNPFWAPDGENVYFLSNRQMKEEGKKVNRLWTLSLEGGEARLIVEVKNGITAPKVSPDGSRILFTSRVEDVEAPEEPEEGALWITKLRYKMNGQPFFPYTRVHLFTVESTGGEPVQLTRGPYDIMSPDWSPDGSEIVYLANPNDSDHTRVRDIYVTQMEGGALRRITKGGAVISSVAWSPDGKLLAYGGREPEDTKRPGYGNCDVWVVAPDGDGKRNLTADFDRTVGAYDSEIIWGGDGAIYFRAPDRGCWNVYKVHPDGGGVKAVVEGRQTVSSFSLNEDASVIAYDSTCNTWPSEVHVKDGGGSRRLTDVNTDLMADWEISEPEDFWFTASDGVKVQGWMVKPHGYMEGEKYPLILKIHGGPHSQFCYRLSVGEHEIQLLARNGYAVIYTNPRDSVGYGEEFAGLVEGDWGSRDYLDLMEAVDYILESYRFVDPDRLGVTGGSFGGFMTNWVVSHTDRFKAAVTTMSVCNWYSQIGLSDVSWGHSGVGTELEPWQVPDQYLRMSPITYVDAIKTPLLIMAGEIDLRCPVAESDQLYYALKRLRREVEYVRFEGESHMLSMMGKPSHREYRLRHLLRWFEKHLK